MQPENDNRPRWLPSWAPSGATLDYLSKLATIAFLALGLLFFAGFDSLRPFAQKHVAAL